MDVYLYEYKVKFLRNTFFYILHSFKGFVRYCGELTPFTQFRSILR